MNIWDIEGIQYFLAILPIVAFLYASVGHGGASGYLAIMAIWAFPTSLMKPTALLLNLFVAAISFIAYYRKGHFNWKLFWPFALTSIPLAFVGGMMEVDATVYKKVLAGLLIFAILRMLGLFGKDNEETRFFPLWQALISGAVIGFLSGLIGIGGGIILTPLIILMRWGTMKQAAAVSAAFIWVNSAAGLLGLSSQGISVDAQSVVLVGIAVVGGAIGGYFGSMKFNTLVLKRVLAFVLIIACAKLILT